MSEQDNNSSGGMVPFKMETAKTIIKVIGVGGGGGNAVNHMYSEGIYDVSFALCNTDNQALMDSPIPVKLQLGKDGLGAGNRPERAKAAAEESIDDIQNMLKDGTQMVFITAGMGGGTGTGAAPVVARVSRQLGILTVGIVTIPFRFEGDRKIIQALDGVDAISKEVDALLVINNERLREVYTDISLINAFKRADDTLSNAAKSIAEIITRRGIINIDFNDVKTVLKDGGVAIISTGYGEGTNRLEQAINNALHSPLLNNNDIYNSKKILLSVSQPNTEEGAIMMEEMNEIHKFMSNFKKDYENKFGLSDAEDLGKKVKVTILASGFGLNNIAEIKEKKETELRRREETLAEDEEKERTRIGQFYGENSGEKICHRRIFIFSTEDLDNDDIIASVESTATCMRSSEELKNIKAKSPLTNKVNKASSASDSSETMGITPIVFS